MLWMMLIGTAAALSCGLLGCYLVLRRVSLLGDAISHAVLPGIALAFLFTGERTGPGIVFGAMVLGILTSFLTDSIHRAGKLPEDASMGVVFTSLFALGVLIMSNAAPKVDLDVNCILYGALEFAEFDRVEWPVEGGLDWPRAFWNLLVTLVLTIGFIVVFWKELTITSFDPTLATALGFNAMVVHYLLMALVAGVTVASFEAVGSILVIAMLIVPGATAHLMSDRLIGMVIWSGVVSILSAVGGVALAVALNVNAAGMIAVTAGAQFGLAVFLSPRHGLIRRWVRRVRLALRIRAEDMLAGLYRIDEAGDQGIDRERHRRRMSRESGGVWGWLAGWDLRWRGLIIEEEGGLHLTPLGRRYARSLVRSHRLWESYLSREFELPPDHVHDPAEMMEHFLDSPLREEIASELPPHSGDTDPHGRPIPPE